MCIQQGLDKPASDRHRYPCARRTAQEEGETERRTSSSHRSNNTTRRRRDLQENRAREIQCQHALCTAACRTGALMRLKWVWPWREVAGILRMATNPVMRKALARPVTSQTKTCGWSSSTPVHPWGPGWATQCACHLRRGRPLHCRAQALTELPATSCRASTPAEDFHRKVRPTMLHPRRFAKRFTQPPPHTPR